MGFIIYDGARWHERPKTGYYANSRRTPSLLHRYVWTKHHGPIPPRAVVHHRYPNDKATTDVTRLELIGSQSEHVKHQHSRSTDWHRLGGLATWRDKQPTKRICGRCGKTYLSRATVSRSCSSACRDASAPSRAPQRRLCCVCGSKFTTTRRSAAQTCSYQCRARYIADRRTGRI